MIKRNDVIRIKVPFPGLSSNLVKASSTNVVEKPTSFVGVAVLGDPRFPLPRQIWAARDFFPYFHLV